MATIGAINDAAPAVGTDASQRSGGSSTTTTLPGGGSQFADTFSLTPTLTLPLLDSSTAAMLASAPRTASADTPLSDASLTGNVGDSLACALKQVATDGKGALADALKDPKKVALVTAGIGAAVGVQFIPVVGEAVDTLAGVAGVAMYAAGGQEHKARIGQALGEFKQYLSGVASAKTQGQLDAASAHLAKFLEIGGDEAAQALLTVAGAAAAPAKFAGLLSKVKELGGLEGVASAGAAALGDLGAKAKTLASDAGELATRGWSAIKGAAADAAGALESAGREAWQAAGRVVNSTAGAINDGLDWLGRQLGISGPEPALAGAGGRIEAGTGRRAQDGIHQMSATGSGGGGLAATQRVRTASGIVFDAPLAARGADATASSDVVASINKALTSSDPGMKFQGYVAEALRAHGIKVEKFDHKIFDPAGKQLGDVDIETSQGIIEVGVGVKGKLEQMTKYTRLPAQFNPNSKQQILFAPKYGASAGRDVQALSNRPLVARSLADLIDLLR